jgi:hypothetical protein
VWEADVHWYPETESVTMPPSAKIVKSLLYQQPVGIYQWFPSKK